MSEFFKDLAKDFDPELRDPNQTREQWAAEILANSAFKRAQIPQYLYDQGYSASAAIEDMRDGVIAKKKPGRPRIARNAAYVQRRIANVIWQECGKILGSPKLTADGRKLVCELQEWAEKMGSSFRAPDAE